MEVEYVQTVEDYMAFSRYHHTHRWYSGLSWRWLLVFFFPVWLAWHNLTGPPAPPEAPPPPVDKWAAVLIITAFAIAILLVVVAVRVWVRPYLLALLVKLSLKDPENRKRMLGWRRIVIGPEGLSMRGEGIDSTVKWTAIQRIPVTREHAFLYMTTTNAFIVPRRAFASDADFRDFVATARACQDTARHAPREGSSYGPEAADKSDTNVTSDEHSEVPGDAVMEVEYVQTLEDQVAAVRQHQRSQLRWEHSFLKIFAGVATLSLSGFLFYLLFSPFDSEPPPNRVRFADLPLEEQAILLFMMTAPVAVWVVMFVWGWRFMLELQVKRLVNHAQNKERMLGWRRCSIGPAGVTLGEAGSSSKFAWTTVVRIAQTKEHAFLYTTTATTIVVPRRVFASDAEFQGFVATARAFRDKARRGPRGGELSRRKGVDEPDTNITPGER
jgi:hypothetical protein